MAAPLRQRSRPAFDLQTFLAQRGESRTRTEYKKDQLIYTQGDPADVVFHIEMGTVKVTVGSPTGKEAVIGVLQPGDFLGEACLAGQPLRVHSASAMSECSVLRLPRPLVVRLLQTDTSFSEVFFSYLISRNLRMEEDLVDQLFNSSEKRLARVLLLLANFNKEDKQEGFIPRVSQETLAEMVGTTRSRVSFFMNRFRRQGFIEYNGEIKVRRSLFNVVLGD